MVEEREKQFRKRKGKQPSSQMATKIRSGVGRQFTNALLQIDKALHTSTERTPPPQWIGEKEYTLKEEFVVAEEIAAIEHQIEELKRARVVAESKVEAAASLKGLLYETGRALESAILEALRLLGFKAENYKDDASEFDVLFIDPNGEMLLGEAEGKLDKAINIDKLDQLNRNVQEEFAKREDARYSKGVLFGNAFRLTPVSERGEFFTQKCVAGAARLGFALVRTPDLFPVARYLKENTDKQYAEACRSAILQTAGKIVSFPPVPMSADASRDPATMVRSL